MTATLQPEPKSTSRRALLAGALGGIGAWAASGIGKASPARATDGQALIQGADNSGSVSTLVRSNAATTALQGLVDATSGTGYGLRGRTSTSSGAGVYGVSFNTGGHADGVFGQTSTELGAGVRGNGGSQSGNSGVGVVGTSDGNTGVFGVSDQSYGIKGVTSSSGSAGIIGYTLGDSIGVVGNSSQGNLVSPKTKTGVFGFADQDAASVGVWGESPAGMAVRGSTTSGYAGFFSGRVFTTRYYEMTEIATPNAPSTDKARLFIRDNGANKTQLCVRFSAGSVVVLATQP